MGCDIHLYVERRENGAWVSADTWEPDPYYDPEDVEEGEVATGPRLEVPYEKRFYAQRNYDLFAILADVRNGHGFAGVKTGDGFNPITMPKGLPWDACQQVKEESERWGEDGHSHSWHTVADLLAYDWTQVARHTGCLEPEQWAEFRAKGKPSSWSGGIGGAGVVEVSPEDFENAWQALRKERDYGDGPYEPYHRLKRERGNPDYPRFLELVTKPGSLPDEGGPVIAQNEGALDMTMTRAPAGMTMAFCRGTWETPYYDSVPKFLAETMPRLWRLGRPEDVRIVFWFDN